MGDKSPECFVFLFSGCLFLFNLHRLTVNKAVLQLVAMECVADSELNLRFAELLLKSLHSVYSVLIKSRNQYVASF